MSKKKEEKRRKANIREVKSYIKGQAGKSEGRKFIECISSKQDYILDVANPKKYLIDGLNKSFYQMIAIRDFEVAGRSIKKGQKGGWLEEGANFGKGCWADEQSIIYTERTAVENGTYIKNSSIYDGVILDNTLVVNSTLACFRAGENLTLSYCRVRGSNIRVDETRVFEGCQFKDCVITNNIPSATDENFVMHNDTDGLDFFGPFD